MSVRKQMAIPFVRFELCKQRFKVFPLLCQRPIRLEQYRYRFDAGGGIDRELNFQMSIRRPFPKLQAHVGEHKFDLSVGANSFATQKVRLVGNLLKLWRKTGRGVWCQSAGPDAGNV